MLANHADSKVIFNGEEMWVSSGQLVTGRDAIASIYNRGAKPVHQIAARTLWRWVKQFEKWQMLSIKSTSKYSVISITNYGLYQKDVQPLTSDGPASVQHLSTNKNVKNLKNEKKEKSVSSLGRGELIKFWENNGFGMISSKTREDLMYWVDDFKKIGSTEEQAVAVVQKALAISVDNNVRRYNYANSILQNWESRRLTNVEAINALENKRQQDKKPRSIGGGLESEVYQNHGDVSDDDLPF